MKWRIPVATVSLLLFAWGAAPFLIAGIVNVGVIVPVMVGALGMWAAVCHRQAVSAVRWMFRGPTAVRVVSITVTAGIILLILLFLAVSVVMLCNANRTAPDTQVTLVIPGAKVNGKQPSLMLYDRITAAAEYLKANPHVSCVVSGGQGEDEGASEAQVMYEYLVAAGIKPARIYREDRSTNTFENMQYTCDVIKQNGLPTRVVIVTQEFHQYRCAMYAREAALEPVGTVTCQTPSYLFLCYWVREFAGIGRMWLLGY